METIPVGPVWRRNTAFMKTPFRWLLLTVDMALALGPVIHAAIPQRWRERRCGAFSKSAGVEHEAIKRVMKDGKPAYAFAVLREIGAQQNIEFTFSKDGSLFTPDFLAQFDAFFFTRLATSRWPRTVRCRATETRR